MTKELEIHAGKEKQRKEQKKKELEMQSCKLLNSRGIEEFTL